MTYQEQIAAHATRKWLVSHGMKVESTHVHDNVVAFKLKGGIHANYQRLIPLYGKCTVAVVRYFMGRKTYVRVTWHMLNDTIVLERRPHGVFLRYRKGGK